MVSNHQLLEAWESARGLGPVRRGRTLARLALPSLSPAEVAELSTGQIDRALLELRRRVIGPTQDATANCPACAERVEFSFPLEMVLNAQSDAAADNQNHRVHAGAYACEFRLIRPDDLEAAAATGSVARAKECLVTRCVTRVSVDGVEQALPLALPADVIARLAEALGEADPLADLRFDLRCPACDHRWSARFDALNCLWQEIESFGWRMLEHVHVLASAYGWSERDILELAPARRAFYLSCLGAS
jgi:hypothetical protein